MDNDTYEGLDLAPISNDETYSRLRTAPSNNKPRYEPQRRVDIDKIAETNVRQLSNSKDSQNKAKHSTVLIIVIAILLLFIVVLIVLSVITYSQLTSEQSRLVGLINNTNNEISALKGSVESDGNIIQDDIKMEIVSTCANVSHTLTQMDNKISEFLSVLQQNPSVLSQLYCGPGTWNRVAYLNMSNPTAQCPSAWREYNTNGVRACGRPASSSGSCPAIQYSTCNQYSRVCGRIIGYQVASPDAFDSNSDQSADGVIITHGTHHIWSYVASLTERSTSTHSSSTCPCSNTDGQAQNPPASIGNNYYCESGNSESSFRQGHLYQEDKLWDGEQCEGTCCNGTNSPPWFSVQLSAPTTDAIHICICCNQGTRDEDIPVELIEIYVQ